MMARVNLNRMCYLFEIIYLLYGGCEGRRIEDLVFDLKNTDGLDFSLYPDLGEVFIWKISENQETHRQVDYSAGFTRFESEEVAILLAKKASEIYCIHYWVGSKAPLGRKKKAATYATILRALIFDVDGPHNVNFSREHEGVESESFQHTVDLLNKTGDIDFKWHRDGEIPARSPNMYILRGFEETSLIKKVPLATYWLKSDICIILETGFEVNNLCPINIYCGAQTPNKIRHRARKFAASYYFYYCEYNKQSNENPYILLTNKRELEFKEFLEILEDNKNHNPYEVDISNDHLKNAASFIDSRKEAVSVFKIETTNFKKEKIENWPITSKIFYDYTSCYILNSESIAGIHVLFGFICDTDKMVQSLVMAEEYLHNDVSYILRPTQMRIMTTIPQDLKIDFNINLSDWPYDPVLHRANKLW